MNKLIEKYNQAVPRYTSYPPANHFTDDYKAEDYRQLIELSNTAEAGNMGIYIHIPFCQQICYYCGCNALKLTKHSKIEPYIEALKKEMSIVFDTIKKDRPVSQIHFGGGTPNAIDAHYLKAIIAIITNHFSLIENPEIAIECHPGLLSYNYLDELLDAGFNRFSLGIQDFDQEVLKSVNRKPASIPVEDIVNYLRNKQPSVGINLDFIYGLPKQTADSFAQSIKKAIAINPDRLVTFSYAHVPWLKKHQEILDKQGLPDSNTKMSIFQKASSLMQEAGYRAIGFDHFAKADDELSIALEEKQLHRNFQGYCTRRTTGEVFAFGVSAISQLNKGYAQNTKAISTYIESINEGILPIERGLSLNDETAIVREVINQLMCNQYINWPSLATQLNISTPKLKSIVNYAPKALEAMKNDGLLTFNDDEAQTTELGKTFIRNIAVLFDPMFKETENLYSKTV